MIIIIRKGIIYLGMRYMRIHSHDLINTLTRTLPFNNESYGNPCTRQNRFTPTYLRILCNIWV